MVRLTQLHGTEQVQEQSDSIQRVADELLNETAQKNPCVLKGELSTDPFLEERYCKVVTTAKRSEYQFY